MSYLTYTNYLKVDELLALQERRSDPAEHDEMLFIVIHQVYELWFKQMLHEAALLQQSLESNDQPLALATIKRMLTILKTMVSQIDVLETMTPLSFNSFRERLESASGFQSLQFRELEAVIGLRNERLLSHQAPGTAGHDRLMQHINSRSLFDSLLRFLAANDIAIPDDALDRDVTKSWEPNETVQQCLLEVYRNHPPLMQICERFVDFDEGMQEWRYRHVKMVERTIGMKEGTGGSAGAGYLRSTLFQPAFPDLWAIRSSL